MYGYFGDLRNNIVKDGVFDSIICGSVLEHIGMNNARIYWDDSKFNENKRKDYLTVVNEFKRVLKKNGTCLITVPFGIRKNYGWFQVFDYKMIHEMVKIFGVRNSTITFYKYTSTGWVFSDGNQCKGAEYFDVRKKGQFLANKQAAAGAVACIKLIKE